LIALQPVIDALAVRANLRERVGRVEAPVADELERIAAERLVPDFVTALTAAPECIRSGR
jgi:hypothetical protein